MSRHASHAGSADILGWEPWPRQPSSRRQMAAACHLPLVTMVMAFLSDLHEGLVLHHRECSDQILDLPGGVLQARFMTSTEIAEAYYTPLSRYLNSSVLAGCIVDMDDVLSDEDERCRLEGLGQ